MIACVVLPDFAPVIERLHTPEYQNKALIVGDYSKSRGRVLAASETARQAGVDLKMALSRARGLCPESELVTAAPDRYQAMVDQLFEVFWQYTDRVEHDKALYPQTGIFYLDIGQLTETETRWLGEQIIDATVIQTRLKPSIGIAKSQFPAFVAGSFPAKPVTYVQPGRESDFLAPFPINLLSLTKPMERKLDLLRIKTLGQFAELPRASVLAQFGKPGVQAYQLACGLASRPLHPQSLQKLEIVRRDFEGTLTDLQTLERVFKDLAKQLSLRLERSNQAASSLTLTLQFEDHTVHTEQLSLNHAIYGQERLFRVLQRPLHQMELQVGIIGLEIHLDDLSPFQPEQLDLFTFKPQQQRLKEAIANLIERYGQDCFYEVIEIDQDALLIERRFDIRQVQPE
jgi:DNA polymerase-4